MTCYNVDATYKYNGNGCTQYFWLCVSVGAVSPPTFPGGLANGKPSWKLRTGESRSRGPSPHFPLLFVRSTWLHLHRGTCSQQMALLGFHLPLAGPLPSLLPSTLTAGIEHKTPFITYDSIYVKFKNRRP